MAIWALSSSMLPTKHAPPDPNDFSSDPVWNTKGAFLCLRHRIWVVEPSTLLARPYMPEGARNTVLTRAKYRVHPIDFISV
jgi:hypothetical protein